MNSVLLWIFENVAGPCPGGFQFSWGFIVATTLFAGLWFIKTKTGKRARS